VLRACHRYSIFSQTAKVLLGSFFCGLIDQGVADHLLSALCHPGKQRLPPEADYSQSQNGDKGFDSMAPTMVVMRKPFLRFLEAISLLQKVIGELLPASSAENRAVCHHRIAAGADLPYV
jgi:hypothetical protein